MPARGGKWHNKGRGGKGRPAPPDDAHHRAHMNPHHEQPRPMHPVHTSHVPHPNMPPHMQPMPQRGAYPGPMDMTGMIRNHAAGHMPGIDPAMARSHGHPGYPPPGPGHMPPHSSGGPAGPGMPQPPPQPHAADTPAMALSYNTVQLLRSSLFIDHASVAKGVAKTRRRVDAFSLSEHRRVRLAQKEALTFAVPAGDAALANIPQQVRNLHTLLPLESESAVGRFGVRTRVFKAVSSTEGGAVALTQLQIGRLAQDPKLIRDGWGAIAHPCLAGLRDIFITDAFGDGMNFVACVHEFVPLSTSVMKQYVGPAASNIPAVAPSFLWFVASQLLSLCRVVHSHNRALRCLHISKLLLDGDTRIKVSGVGILDLVSAPNSVHDAMCEDVAAIGQAILAIGTKEDTTSQPGSAARSLEFFGSQYGAELKSFVASCLQQPSSAGGSANPARSPAFDLSTRYAAGLLTATEVLLSQSEGAERELCKEYENGRLLRLLMKMNFVTDKPDLNGDEQWSDTGDRYLLKLFRDYMFHQVTQEDKPVVDYGSVVACLNKTDAATPERLMLMPRDESSLIIVTYADLHRCIQGAFGEVVGAATGMNPRPIS